MIGIDFILYSVPDNRYSTIIQDTYNGGYRSFFASYSYKCVEDIVAILESIITRLKRNPELCAPNQNVISSMAKPIEYPEKVTLVWLAHNVPHSFWFWLISALIAAFLFGVSIGQSKLYQDLMTKKDSLPASIKNQHRWIQQEKILPIQMLLLSKKTP